MHGEICVRESEDLIAKNRFGSQEFSKHQNEFILSFFLS